MPQDHERGVDVDGFMQTLATHATTLHLLRPCKERARESKREQRESGRRERKSVCLEWDKREQERGERVFFFSQEIIAINIYIKGTRER